MKDKKRLLIQTMADILSHYSKMIDYSEVENDIASSRHYRAKLREAAAFKEALEQYVYG